MHLQHALPHFSTCAALASDACKEGAEIPGIGGFFAGYWWTLAYEAHHLTLDIPVLELIAFAVNLMVFEHLLGPIADADDTLILAYIDAQASAVILSRGSAHSPVMQFVHRAILGMPVFEKCQKCLAVAHLRGEANYPSDCSSRHKLEELKAYCVQMGVTPIQLEVPERAMGLLDAAVRFIESNTIYAIDEDISYF